MERGSSRQTGAVVAYDPALAIRVAGWAAFAVVADLGSGKTLRPPPTPPREGAFGEDGRKG